MSLSRIHSHTCVRVCVCVCVYFCVHPPESLESERVAPSDEMAELVAPGNSVLCSDHFEKDYFEQVGSHKWLRRNAVPTIFNFPKHLQSKASQNSLCMSVKWYANVTWWFFFCIAGIVQMSFSWTVFILVSFTQVAAVKRRSLVCRKILVNTFPESSGSLHQSVSKQSRIAGFHFQPLSFKYFVYYWSYAVYGI